ncbi:hypothetical protein [Chryseobacterium sp.]|nr:hypothetical protein [Chryseobacterium sp.]
MTLGITEPSRNDLYSLITGMGEGEPPFFVRNDSATHELNHSTTFD